MVLGHAERPVVLGSLASMSGCNPEGSELRPFEVMAANWQVPGINPSALSLSKPLDSFHHPFFIGFFQPEARQISCWPSTTADGTQIVLELELTDLSVTLEDVQIRFPAAASSRPSLRPLGLSHAMVKTWVLNGYKL